MNLQEENVLARRRLITPAVLAVLIGLPWQYLQYPLYAHEGGEEALWSHVILGAFGDGALVLLLYLLGWYRTRSDGWYEHRSAKTYALIAAAGAGAACVIELAGVYVVHRWGYAPSMPLLPLLRIGLVPLLEGAIVPVAAFAAAGFLRRGTPAAGSSP